MNVFSDLEHSNSECWLVRAKDGTLLGSDTELESRIRTISGVDGRELNDTESKLLDAAPHQMEILVATTCGACLNGVGEHQ